MDGMNEGLPETALKRLFIGDRRSDDVTCFSLPGGRSLFLAGEAADTLYFVRTGRLGVVRREEAQDQQFFGIVKPGEPVGEMALLAGTPHSATAIALRDSEILALPRAAFFAEARRRPDLMAELARLMILRVRETGARTSAGDPIVFGFVGVARGVRVRRLVEQLERCIVAQGFTVTVVGAEAASAPTEWFSTVEQRHDHVLYVAEADETAWAEQCGHQVDRLFHLRRDDAADTARLARVLTRSSVGLVLSGGGARAYAHLGAIRALKEAGSPIDFIGGTSMGAMIGAGLAVGWDEAELERRIRHAFVDSSPVADIALPIIAMTRGETTHKRILENFDGLQIADLWLPFFCVSSNLTTGHHQVHRRGGLAWALQASSALPGVRPPVIDGDAVLVDGAVLRNFPADVMRAWHRGPVVGVDVSRSRGLTAADMKPPPSILRWLLSGDFLKGPPIVSLLMRAATVSTERELAAAREATDLLIQPKVDAIEIRDWKAFEPAVQAGYDAAVLALKEAGPVTEVRRKTLAAAAALAG
jgi:NTE family protein